jgi:hypothetical protein
MDRVGHMDIAFRTSANNVADIHTPIFVHSASYKSHKNRCREWACTGALCRHIRKPFILGSTKFSFLNLQQSE